MLDNSLRNYLSQIMFDIGVFNFFIIIPDGTSSDDTIRFGTTKSAQEGENCYIFTTFAHVAASAAPVRGAATGQRGGEARR